MEFSVIIAQAYRHFAAGKKTVLATIVALDGSSYRKEGTRMLMAEDGEMTFALSGGCIEMYVFREASEVFKTGQSKVIIYDGNERLGCEGVLYILLERIAVDTRLYEKVKELESGRKTFDLISYFKQEDLAKGSFGTLLVSEGQPYSLQGDATDVWKELSDCPDQFRQTIHPPFKLILFGSGHDVQSFSRLAYILGWSITVVLCEESPRQPGDFPEATKVIRATGARLEDLQIDEQSAAVVMTHNFRKDQDYIQGLLAYNAAYIGMIGSLKRKGKLEDGLAQIGIDTKVMDRIHTPAGLDIGASTPEEIALSILSEILAVTRHRSGLSLKHMERLHIGSLNT